GSIISAQSQGLGEQVPIAGTPFTLNYDSTREAGRTDGYALEIPLSGPTLPADLAGITLTVDLAGRHFEQSFPPPPSPTTTFPWDGKDALGRTVRGAQAIAVSVGYVYPAVYMEPSALGKAFGALSGVPIGLNPARDEITLFQNWTGSIGGFDALALGLGGW